MPYKLSLATLNGFKAKADYNKKTLPWDLTDLQKKALEYLYEHKDENRYIDAHEVATFYGYKNGMWFRGVLASLHKKGLLEKKEE